MIYADYTYYKERSCGNLIPQERFEYLSARASEYESHACKNQKVRRV